MKRMETTTTFALTSNTMRHGERIPMQMVYDAMGCTGQNRSPDLQWLGAPDGTKSYALAMFDPDAPTTVGFGHWIVYDIPRRYTSLEEGAGSSSGHPHLHGARSGRNDYGERRYDGPCPPPGDPPHHYHLTVYAVDCASLNLPPGAPYARFKFALRDHVLAQSEIVGVYGR
jgi:Raf kinase inhibitor-like YbhB/YbcL family protein